MSIILAIEPDRRRAAQLTGMARAHLKAELLVAATASQAVEALAGRVPDVLLTAPLLPSQEEGAIGDYLREMGQAAAHVQTLTIPLLTSVGDRDRPVLSAFRRGRTQRSEAEGCDPAVFAEQINEYLREARERRATLAVQPPPAVESLETQEIPITRALTKRETVSQLLASLFPATEEETTQKPRASAERRDEPPAEMAEFFVTESDVAAPFAASSPLPDRDDADSMSTYQLDPLPIAKPVVPIRQERTAIPLPEPSVQQIVAMPTSDAQRAVDLAVAVSPNVGGDGTSTPKSRRARKAPAIQDEWAFFDPDQCGFPALIAKLDEIAARDSDS